MLRALRPRVPSRSTVRLPSAGGGVWTLTSNDGSDTLIEIERVQFSDAMLGLDIEGNAGQAYRLYQAAFDRVPDQVGLGYWISALDSGFGLNATALFFIQSAEFEASYGSPGTVSNQQFLTLLYANVLDRVPDQAGLAYWLNDMANGYSRESVLVSFSESAENKQNVIGAIENGIEYTAWLG
jgi:Domain of unknown function (DUF4214)